MIVFIHILSDTNQCHITHPFCHPSVISKVTFSSGLLFYVFLFDGQTGGVDIDKYFKLMNLYSDKLSPTSNVVYQLILI
jgi:hypothetical protein